MKEKFGNEEVEIYDFASEIESGIEESSNEMVEETDEENELRLKSLLRSNQERQEGENIQVPKDN